MKHARTYLKLPKNNTGAKIGMSAIGLLVLVLGITERMLDKGTLPVPPDVQPYVPFIVAILGAVLTMYVGGGTPHYSPDDAPNGGA